MNNTENIVKAILTFSKRHKLTISTMESCTAGLLAQTLSRVEGASSVLVGGYITYQTEQKIRCGVSNEIIDKYTVYSKECATSMAIAARENSSSSIGIGITGVLSNTDEENNGNETRTVYYSIYNGNNLVNKVINIPDCLNIRIEQQEYIVKIILDDLWDLLCVN